MTLIDSGRFDELERNHIAENTPGWRWCLFPGCRSGQVHGKKTSNAVPSIPNKRSGRKKVTDTTTTEVTDPEICKCKECGARACVP